MPVDYLGGYPEHVREQAADLLAAGRLERLVLGRRTEPNPAPDNARLYSWVMDLKRTHLKSSPPLSKVRYSEKIATLHRALGLHSYVYRQQGSKTKRKNELRVASVFRELPGDFLRMIVVHELAHLRHKDHGKAFYRLCCHMEPEYHQLELDLRLLLYARQGA